MKEDFKAGNIAFPLKKSVLNVVRSQLKCSTTVSITAFSIITLSVKGSYGTLGVNDTQRNNAHHNVECCILFIVMLRVILLSVLMLNVIMLSVVEPFKRGLVCELLVAKMPRQLAKCQSAKWYLTKKVNTKLIVLTPSTYVDRDFMNHPYTILTLILP